MIGASFLGDDRSFLIVDDAAFLDGPGDEGALLDDLGFDNGGGASDNRGGAGAKDDEGGALDKGGRGGTLDAFAEGGALDDTVVFGNGKAFNNVGAFCGEKAAFLFVPLAGCLIFLSPFLGESSSESESS